jgi:hypothetical protein
MLRNLTVRFAPVIYSNMEGTGDLAQSERLLTVFEIRQLFSVSANCHPPEGRWMES